jgi:hypothetical protein
MWMVPDSVSYNYVDVPELIYAAHISYSIDSNMMVVGRV